MRLFGLNLISFLGLISPSNHWETIIINIAVFFKLEIFSEAWQEHIRMSRFTLIYSALQFNYFFLFFQFEKETIVQMLIFSIGIPVLTFYFFAPRDIGKSPENLI